MDQGVAIGVKCSTPAPVCPSRTLVWVVTRAQGDGSHMEMPTTRKDGLPARTPWSQAYFLEVEASGYQPYRRRLDPNEAQLQPGNPPPWLCPRRNQRGETGAVEPPLIQKHLTSWTGSAPFLPGVKKSGDQNIFNEFEADRILTMTWLVGVRRPEPLTVQLPGYDDAQGNPGEPVRLKLTDDLAEVWLVDLRAFTIIPMKIVRFP